jgi:chromosome transmission fidelity protein 1
MVRHPRGFHLPTNAPSKTQLLGFLNRHVPTVEGGKAGDNVQSRHISPLRHVEAFFGAICNANEDGRIVLLRGDPSNDGQPSIKFMLLNPGVYFEEILLESRAVILAGGTMTPMNDFVDQLTTPKVGDLPVRQRFSKKERPSASSL